MPRSSTRHTREVHGYDVALNQAADYVEYNDFTALNTSPQSGDGVNLGAGPGTPGPQANAKAKKRRRRRPATDTNGTCADTGEKGNED